ncbi:endothelial cell-selective adhesion molecule isoform X1 [Dromaius novaehollandiae]|uniref:endothelial cell-selective adhesion molecule isoform X1 n=1 Tax=Dromaius novaehollandiae TaxID=8790 RepID=UPI00311E2058
MRALAAAALALAALLGPAAAMLEVHVASGSVFAVEGRPAVLPVWYTSRSQKKPYVTWLLHKPDADPFQILTYLDGVVKVEESDLKRRISFLYPVLSHNLSVLINGTQEHDSGQYMCTVNVADDSSSTGKNVGVINLTVLVPPAAPACRLQGSPAVGGNVTLSCASRKGKPLPSYQWQRAAPAAQVFFPPMQDRARGTLKLTNLSLDMSGVYVCAAENRAGSATCNVTLEVLSSSNAAVVAGAVLGSLVGFGLLVFLGLQLRVYRRKKRDGQEEAANEIKEDAVAPKSLAWAKSAAPDAASRTSTLSSAPGARPKLEGPRAASDAASDGPANGTAGSRGRRPQGPPRHRPPPAAAGLARMGAVAVMVPAQSQAGSLV